MINTNNHIDERKIFIGIILITGILLGLTCLSSCTKEFPVKPFYEGIYEGMDQSIYEFIDAKQDTFSRFKDLIRAGELEETLKAYNPHGNDYTLFLPTNEAVDLFISTNGRYETFQDLVGDQDYVKTLTRYHIVNTALKTNDFPLGALPDTTMSGDLLIINFSGDVDSTVLKVDNYASIIEPNIELINGYVHVIDKLLTPVVSSSYEWLQQRPECSIFTRALEITGIRDTFKITTGEIVKFPPNTLLVETDGVFNEKQISSVDDLIKVYSPDRQDYTDYSNGLYQFVAYHILEGKRFLNDFEGEYTNYNTYASLPVSVNGKGIDIKINEGADIFDTLVSKNDTTIINFVRIDYDQSNVTSRNGAIHFIRDVMEPYTPRSVERTFQFYEEPLINTARQDPGTYLFDDPGEFEVIKWHGVEEISYVKSSSNISGVWNDDYLEIEGEFSISYEIPKILPGIYMMKIRTNAEDDSNAIIQVFFDGKRVGGNIDLTTGNNFISYDIGQLSFVNYEKHHLEIQTLIAGRLTWDAVQFVPMTKQ